jgi:hypothetical protein
MYLRWRVNIFSGRTLPSPSRFSSKPTKKSRRRRQIYFSGPEDGGSGYLWHVSNRQPRTWTSSAHKNMYIAIRMKCGHIIVVHPVFPSPLCMYTARVKCRSLPLGTGRECAIKPPSSSTLHTPFPLSLSAVFMADPGSPRGTEKSDLTPLFYYWYDITSESKITEPERWSLLLNDSVKTFPWQPTHLAAVTVLTQQ